MKKNTLLLILLFTFIVLSGTSAQEEIAPFVWKKHKALPLSKKSLLLLTDRTWTTYRQYQIIQDTASIRTGNFMGFKLTTDGQLGGSMMGKNSLKGTWKQNGKKALLFTGIDSNAVAQEFLRNGEYVIYKLDENELVLGETQQDGTAQRILYCKGNKVNVFAEPYKPSPVNPTVKPDPKEIEAIFEKREKAALLPEIETEMLLRGIKMPRKLEEMDVKYLQVLKRQVLAGVYGQKQITS